MFGKDHAQLKSLEELPHHIANLGAMRCKTRPPSAPLAEAVDVWILAWMVASTVTMPPYVNGSDMKECPAGQPHHCGMLQRVSVQYFKILN